MCPKDFFDWSPDAREGERNARPESDFFNDGAPEVEPAKPPEPAKPAPVQPAPVQPAPGAPGERPEGEPAPAPGGAAPAPGGEPSPASGAPTGS